MESTSTLLALCKGNLLVTLSLQKSSVMQNFDIFFIVNCNKLKFKKQQDLKCHFKKQQPRFQLSWCLCDITVMHLLWASTSRNKWSCYKETKDLKNHSNWYFWPFHCISDKVIIKKFCICHDSCSDWNACYQITAIQIFHWISIVGKKTISKMGPPWMYQLLIIPV